MKYTSYYVREEAMEAELQKVLERCLDSSSDLAKKHKEWLDTNVQQILDKWRGVRLSDETRRIEETDEDREIRELRNKVLEDEALSKLGYVEAQGYRRPHKFDIVSILTTNLTTEWFRGPKFLDKVTHLELKWFEKERLEQQGKIPMKEWSEGVKGRLVDLEEVWGQSDLVQKKLESWVSSDIELQKKLLGESLRKGCDFDSHGTSTFYEEWSAWNSTPDHERSDTLRKTAVHRDCYLIFATIDFAIEDMKHRLSVVHDALVHHEEMVRLAAIEAQCREEQRLEFEDMAMVFTPSTPSSVEFQYGGDEDMRMAMAMSLGESFDEMAPSYGDEDMRMTMAMSLGESFDEMAPSYGDEDMRMTMAMSLGESFDEMAPSYGDEDMRMTMAMSLGESFDEMAPSYGDEDMRMTMAMSLGESFDEMAPSYGDEDMRMTMAMSLGESFKQMAPNEVAEKTSFAIYNIPCEFENLCSAEERIEGMSIQIDLFGQFCFMFGDERMGFSDNSSQESAEWIIDPNNFSRASYSSSGRSILELIDGGGDFETPVYIEFKDDYEMHSFLNCISTFPTVDSRNIERREAGEVRKWYPPGAWFL